MSLIEEALTKKERQKEGKEEKAFTLPSDISSKRPSFLKVKKEYIIALALVCVSVVLGFIFLKKFYLQPVVRKSTKVISKKELRPLNKIETKISVPAKTIVSTPPKKPSLPPSSNSNKPTDSQSNLVRPKPLKQQTYYTVQLGTFRRLQGAKEIFYSVSCPEKRIEKINEFYVVRCGLFQDKEKAVSLEKSLMKKGLNNLLVISSFPPEVIKHRIVLKQPQSPLLNKNKPFQRFSKTNKETNTLLKRAYIYLESNQLAQALRLYNKILEITPYQTEALINRGIIWQKLGEFKKAEKDFLAALKINPNDPDLLNALGVNYLKLGQYKKAEEHFLKAGNAKAMINLAILHWQRGKLEKVFVYLNKALVLSPDDPYVHYYLGLYYQSQQDWTKANEEFSLCRQLAEEKGFFELLNKLKEKVY